MTYLIDTDTLVSLARGNVAIQERMINVGIDHCLMSEISLAELYVGVYKGASKDSFVQFLEKRFKVLPITPALRTYAQIRAQLELQGRRLEDSDLFIAATALVNGYTLVSHNTRHFSRIPGLLLEDWLE